MNDIYDCLKNLAISYETYKHPAVFTIEDAAKYFNGIDTGESKNLFLRNQKGTVHYLVVAESRKKIDLKRLQELLKETKLSFASKERLYTYLGVFSGSVSPFGLINNADKSVRVIIGRGLLTYSKLAFHPNINTATLVIHAEDLKKFLEWTGNKIYYLEL